MFGYFIKNILFQITQKPTRYNISAEEFSHAEILKKSVKAAHVICSGRGRVCAAYSHTKRLQADYLYRNYTYIIKVNQNQKVFM